MTAGEVVHGGCVLLGEAGILIRGPSGAGKSTLARTVVARASLSGLHAAHVADDRVSLTVRHGRLLARPVPAIAGRLEVRGLGLVRVPFAPAALVRLVLDLLPSGPPRLPEPADLVADVLGLRLPRLPVTREDAIDLLLWRVRGTDDTCMTVL